MSTLTEGCSVYSDVYELSSVPATPTTTGSEKGILHSVAGTSEPDSSVNIQQLPPVDGGHQAWLFCFASFILEMLVWGFGFSYGIFQTYYTSHAPFETKSHLAITAIGPTTLAIQYGEGIILSFLHTRYPGLLNPMMWYGLALASVSLFVSSFVSHVELLILLQGVCLGIGSGMLYWPTMFLIPEWFVQRRGLAGGIIFAGSGIGGFVFPFIVNGLLDSVGFRWTLRVWAAIMAVFGGAAIFGIRRRIPVPKYRSEQARPRLIPRNMQFFKNPIFWFFSLAYLFQSMSYFPVSLYIAVFTATVSTPLSATIVLSVFNSAGVVGQVIIGWLSDRIPYPRIMVISTLASSLAAFLLWGYADSLGRIFSFAVIFGALSGGFSSVAFAASTDSAGANPEQSSMAMSAFTVVKGFAAIIGPVVSGILLEAGKSPTFSGQYGRFGYGAVELFVGSCAAVTSISSLVVAATRPART